MSIIDLPAPELELSPPNGGAVIMMGRPWGLWRTKSGQTVLMLMLASEGQRIMGISKGIAKSRKTALNRWFPAIAGVADSLVNDARTPARLETAEILTDVEQISSLFSSMEDWRVGQIVSMDSAFGDI